MQTRRDFLSTTLKGTAAALAASTLPTPLFAQEKPNVLFIAVDDLNDWIGCLGGHPDAVTPNLDRLASRSTLFTRAYCNAPACNPSRGSLATGKLPTTTGVYENAHSFRQQDPDAVTLMQHFMANGYYVAGRGKITRQGQPADTISYHDYIPQGPDPMPPNPPLNGYSETWFDWGPIDAPVEEMDDWKVAQWGKEVLSRKHDKPFFLACGFYRPHLPWYVPKMYFDMFPPDKIELPHSNENDLDDVPSIGREFVSRRTDHQDVLRTDNWRKAVAGYLACIRFADDMIGKLLDTLENSPYADNTMVVLWGDHGWHLGEKLHWRKFALWEEATCVPLMISVPGIAPGQCDRTVSLVDLFPTFVDVCDLSQKDGLDGVSLKPLLEQPDRKWDRPALTTHIRGNHSVRSERWRYIRYSDGAEELYDHQNDKLEWTNLAGQAQYKDIIAAHAAWIPKVEAPTAEPLRRVQGGSGSGSGSR